jgi:hypothetical protein
MQYFIFLWIISYIVTPGNLTYSREELLDIRATSTYQHYYQDYDFPEADPLFGPPPRTMDMIPVGDPKQRRCRRGRQSDLLVRLRRRAHRSPLPSILLTNVQSLDNKRDIRDCNILFHGNMAHLGYVIRVGSATWLLHASRRQKQTSLW